MFRLLPLVLLATLSAEAQPALRLSPDTLRMGEIPVGAEVSGEFVLIESIGDEPITIKIHAAFQPFYMPFDQRYQLAPVTDGLVESRAAILGLLPVRTGPLASDVAVDTDERGAYVVQARATGIDPVAFTLSPGETASRTLEVRNPGFAPLDARTETRDSWARLSATSFSLAPDESLSLGLTVDATGLAPGVYLDTLRAINDGTRNTYDWRVPVTLTVTGTTNQSPQLDEAVPLLTVSPTPSQGPVSVTYQLPSPEPVHLRVFDVRGREVARLAGGVRQRGETTWEAPGPGLYLVHLTTNQETLTRPVVIAR